MNIQTLIKNLETRGFKPFFVPTVGEAIKKVLELVPRGSTVGVGGSQTITNAGIDLALKNENDCTINSSHFATPENSSHILQDAATSQWYLMSTNAVTELGEFVNIDGSCNRVSASIFGVPNILYVLGVNKIVPSIDSAIDRIRNYVAPLNAKRLNRNTPCRHTGKCNFCNSPECMCNATVIAHHPTKHQKNVYVIIVNETLGY